MRVGIVNVLVAMLLPWFAAGGIGNRLRRFLSSKIQRKSRNATKLEYRPLVTEKWDRPHPLPGAAPFGAVDPKEKKREVRN
ncbi:hypothetical protein Pmar_PMAR008222 [Perkinsus marinus ATCC 50983]|uniref:Uncharacterized protein n=1 Tax=Perkinsus marinus (strain ATCC 50983 / TXsc) TaxID=423536 RepID=C5LNM2_PERM5|nr:hypothetical protein Pmar_PMAR008222 [Perkinsus marinus ATCC 50983]EER01641.1 hypothetical protein Pmar_PMAR008222 [Perkinsus marinus ATCC 50983]|eukprot:XP_002768923.1 hypothetical protein Pmar_PMAR008222 [Perkinsus marinus ATCC 50983]